MFALISHLLILALVGTGGTLQYSNPDLKPAPPMQHSTSPASEAFQSSLTLELRCDRLIVTEDQHLNCTVLLKTARSSGFTLVPIYAYPFEMPHRPPAVLSFIIDGEKQPTKKLEISDATLRGRYDVGRMTKSELLLLPPGHSYGWSVDINGGDWLLPRRPGIYRLVAELRVNLLQPSERATIDPVVIDALTGLVGDASSIAMNGVWRSEPLEVTVQRRR